MGYLKVLWTVPEGETLAQFVKEIFCKFKKDQKDLQAFRASQK
jgi:hypothetical protein